jgi:lysophospholipase L1-like esterase
MKRIFFFIFIQLVFITFLGFKIYKQKNIPGPIIINPIRTESVISSSGGMLKFFYEPKANTIDKVNEWIPIKATYTINSDSLNERFDYTVAKPKGTYRIISLGDSYTYGLYVNTKDNYSEKLEDLLNNNLTCKNINKFEVINLGVHGYDIEYSVERFRIRGEKYNSDLVLWLLKNDDVIQYNELMLKKEYFYYKKMTESGEFGKLIKRGILYPSWRLAAQETHQEIGEKNLLKLGSKFLREFKQYYNNALVIFTFPFTRPYYKNIIIQFINSRKNSYFFDKVTNIYQLRNTTASPDDGHPNQKGHQIIARDLFNYLTKNKIIPCN